MMPDITLLGLTISTWTLSLLVAFVAVTLVMSRRMDELDWPTSWAGEAAFLSIAVGLVGAHAYYVVEHGSEHSGDFLTALGDGGGSAWYGGFIAGMLAFFAYAWWRGVFGLRILDVAVLALPVGQAIGRVGCQLAGHNTYGTESDLPWAMGYPDGVHPTPPGVTVHPAPIYEALALGAIAIFLWTRRDSFRPGVLAGLYGVLAGLERFLAEFVRRNEEVAAGLTAAQLLSLVLIAAGLVFIWLFGVRGAAEPQAARP